MKESTRRLFAGTGGGLRPSTIQILGGQLPKKPAPEEGTLSRIGGAMLRAPQMSTGGQDSLAVAKELGQQAVELKDSAIAAGGLMREKGAAVTAETGARMVGGGALDTSRMAAQGVAAIEEPAGIDWKTGIRTPRKKQPGLVREIVAPAMKGASEQLKAGADPELAKSLFGKTAHAAGSTIPFLVGGMVGGITSAAFLGAAANGQGAYDEAIARGMPEDQARTVRVINAVAGLSEAAPIAGLFSRFGGKARVIARLEAAKTPAELQAVLNTIDKSGTLGRFGRGVFDSGVQGVEEFIQEAGQTAVQNISLGDPALKGTLEAGAIGFGTGAAMGAGGAVYGDYRLQQALGKAQARTQQTLEQQARGSDDWTMGGRQKPGGPPAAGPGGPGVALDPDAPAGERPEESRGPIDRAAELIFAIPDGTRGKQQLVARLREFDEAEDPVDRITAMHRLLENAKRMEHDTTELEAVGREVMGSFEGYSTLDLEGRTYNEGMIVDPTFKVDDTLPPDSPGVIARVFEPSIIGPDGKLVKPGKVLVLVPPAAAGEAPAARPHRQIMDELAAAPDGETAMALMDELNAGYPDLGKAVSDLVNAGQVSRNGPEARAVAKAALEADQKAKSGPAAPPAAPAKPTQPAGSATDLPEFFGEAGAAPGDAAGARVEGEEVSAEYEDINGQLAMIDAALAAKSPNVRRAAYQGLDLPDDTNDRDFRVGFVRLQNRPVNIDRLREKVTAAVVTDFIEEAGWDERVFGPESGLTDTQKDNVRAEIEMRANQVMADLEGALGARPKAATQPTAPAEPAVAGEPAARVGPDPDVVGVQGLEEAFGSDEAMGVLFDEEDRPTFPDGSDANICTNGACLIQKMYPEGEVEVRGWEEGESGGALIDQQEGGHDFAVLRGRWLIDPWMKATVGVNPKAEGVPEEARAVYDLEDPADKAIVDKLYGDPTKWMVRQPDGSWVSPEGPAASIPPAAQKASVDQIEERERKRKMREALKQLEEAVRIAEDNLKADLEEFGPGKKADKAKKELERAKKELEDRKALYKEWDRKAKERREGTEAPAAAVPGPRPAPEDSAPAEGVPPAPSTSTAPDVQAPASSPTAGEEAPRYPTYTDEERAGMQEAASILQDLRKAVQAGEPLEPFYEAIEATGAPDHVALWTRKALDHEDQEVVDFEVAMVLRDVLARLAGVRREKVQVPGYRLEAEMTEEERKFLRTINFQPDEPSVMALREAVKANKSLRDVGKKVDEAWKRVEPAKERFVQAVRARDYASEEAATRERYHAEQDALWELDQELKEAVTKAKVAVYKRPGAGNAAAQPAPAPTAPPTVGPAAQPAATPAAIGPAVRGFLAYETLGSLDADLVETLEEAAAEDPRLADAARRARTALDDLVGTEDGSDEEEAALNDLETAVVEAKQIIKGGRDAGESDAGRDVDAEQPGEPAPGEDAGGPAGVGRGTGTGVSAEEAQQLRDLEGTFPPALRLGRAQFSPRKEAGLISDLAEAQPEKFGPLKQIWARLAGGMMEHQRVGAETMFASMVRIGGGLLADGTGAGKTTQILAIAEMFRANPAFPKMVLIIAPSEVLGKPFKNAARPEMAGSYVNDAKRMGVPVRLVAEPSEMQRPTKNGPSPAIYVTTYEKMKDRNFADYVDDNVVVLFDEAHYLKNEGKGDSASKTAEVGAEIANRAYAQLAATATPGDVVHHMQYLFRTGLLEGKGVEKAMDELGVDFKPPKDKEVGYIVLPAGFDPKKTIYKKTGGGIESGSNAGLFQFEELYGTKRPMLNVYKTAGEALKAANGAGFIAEVVTDKDTTIRGVTRSDKGDNFRFVPQRATFVGGKTSYAMKIPTSAFGRTTAVKPGMKAEDLNWSGEPNPAEGRYGSKLMTPHRSMKRVSDEELLRNVQKLFDRMTAVGAMIKREIDMTGFKVNFEFMPIPKEPVNGLTYDQVSAMIIREMSEGRAESLDKMSADKKRIAIGHLRRALETYKIPLAVERIKKAIAEGKQVVLFADRVNASEVNVPRKVLDENGKPMTVKEKIYESEGTMKLLREALKEAGISYAELHGEAEDASAAEAMSRFQTGKAKVVIATIKSGGTGINLDDTTGNAPREMIVLTAPYSANELMQAIGRIHRLTTRSAGSATFIFMETDSDEHTAGIIQTKLAMLGAMVRGGAQGISTKFTGDEDTMDKDLRNIELADMEGPPQTTDRKRQAALFLEPEDPANPKGHWKVYGQTLANKEKIKQAAADASKALYRRVQGTPVGWNADGKFWRVYDSALIPKMRELLGPLLTDAIGGDLLGMPGSRTLPAFIEGIKDGTIRPGRSKDDNDRLVKLAEQAEPGSPAEQQIRGFHEEYVRRAVLAGWEVPDEVMALYPDTVEWAVKERLSREQAAALTELLATGMGKTKSEPEKLPDPPPPKAPKASKEEAPKDEAPPKAAAKPAAPPAAAKPAGKEPVYTIEEAYSRSEWTGEPVRDGYHVLVNGEWAQTYPSKKAAKEAIAAMKRGDDPWEGALISQGSPRVKTVRQFFADWKVTDKIGDKDWTRPAPAISGMLAWDRVVIKDPLFVQRQELEEHTSWDVAWRERTGGLMELYATARRLEQQIFNEKVTRNYENEKRGKPSYSMRTQAGQAYGSWEETLREAQKVIADEIAKRVISDPVRYREAIPDLLARSVNDRELAAKLEEAKLDGETMEALRTIAKARGDYKAVEAIESIRPEKPADRTSPPFHEGEMGILYGGETVMPYTYADGTEERVRVRMALVSYQDIETEAGRVKDNDPVYPFEDSEEFPWRWNLAVAGDEAVIDALTDLIGIPVVNGAGYSADAVTMRALAEIVRGNAWNDYEAAVKRKMEAYGFAEQDQWYFSYGHVLVAIVDAESGQLTRRFLSNDRDLALAQPSEDFRRYWLGLSDTERRHALGLRVTDRRSENAEIAAAQERLAAARENVVTLFDKPLDIGQTWHADSPARSRHLQMLFGPDGVDLGIVLASRFNELRDFADALLLNADILIPLLRSGGAGATFFKTMKRVARYVGRDIKPVTNNDGAQIADVFDIVNDKAGLIRMLAQRVAEFQQFAVGSEEQPAMFPGQVQANEQDMMADLEDLAAFFMDKEGGGQPDDEDPSDLSVWERMDRYMAEAREEGNAAERRRRLKTEQGGFLRMFGRPPRDDGSSDLWPKPDTEAERDLHETQRRAMKRAEPGGMREWFDSAMERIRDLQKLMTNTFKDLPEGGQYTEMVRRLVELSKEMGFQSDQAGQAVASYMRDLDPREVTIFTMKAALDDYVWSRDNGNTAVPDYGSNWDLLDKDWWHWTALATDNPKIMEALAKRREVFELYRAQIGEAAESLGMRAFARIFSNPYYYRHKFIDDQALVSRNQDLRRQKMKLPRRSQYKKRGGSARTIDLDIAQVDLEVLATMGYDTAKLMLFSYVKENFDVIRECRAQARDNNAQHASVLWELEAAAWNQRHPDEPRTPYEQMQKSLNTAIAIGYSRLDKAAKDGKLDDFDGQFEGLILSIASVGSQNLSDSEKAEVFYYLAYALNDGKKNDELTETAAIAAAIFKGMADKRGAVKQALEQLGQKVVTWRSFIPKDANGVPTHREFRMAEGDHFFNALSLDEHVAAQVLAGTWKGPLPASKMQKVLAKGQQRVMVLPIELADTLDTMYVPNPPEGVVGHIVEATKAFTSKLKTQVMSFAPVIIYRNARNMMGDLDASLVNPKALRYVPRAIREMRVAILTRQQPTSKEARDFLRQGGAMAGWDYQEIGYAPGKGSTKIHQIDTLLDQIESRSQWTPEEFVKKIIWPTWLSDFRESILRYANYLAYLDALKANGGLPQFYDDSNPKIIQGLKTIEHRAFRMANDLIGGYDIVPQGVQELSSWALMWIRWKSINYTRYFNLARNLANELAKPAKQRDKAKIAGAFAVVGRKVAWKFFLSTLLLQIGTSIYNAVKFYDEEEELDSETRERMHIFYPRMDGSVGVLNRIGALEDLMFDFGFGWSAGLFRDVLVGRLGGYDVSQQLSRMPHGFFDQASRTGKAMRNAFFEQINPMGKWAWELTAGQEYWPDPSNPRPMTSVPRYLARQFALTELYDPLSATLAMRPQEEGRSAWEIGRPVDAIENRYYELERVAEEWSIRNGYGSFTRPNTKERSEEKEAAYLYRRALRSGQDEIAKYWLGRYRDAGGTMGEMRNSLEMFEPLRAMKKEARPKFLAEMRSTEAGRKLLAYADRWYRELLEGHRRAQ